MKMIDGNEIALEQHLIEQDKRDRVFNDAINEAQSFIDSREGYLDLWKHIKEYHNDNLIVETPNDLHDIIKEWLWDIEAFDNINENDRYNIINESYIDFNCLAYEIFLTMMDRE